MFHIPSVLTFSRLISTAFIGDATRKNIYPKISVREKTPAMCHFDPKTKEKSAGPKSSMITRHIADLLYHHECVIVPGLGGFIKANIPARIIHTSHEFFPPSGTLAFNSGLAANDGLLANHIASVQNTSYREALYEIKKWVEILKKEFA